MINIFLQSWNEGVSDLLHHAHVQALGEGLGGCVQLVEHGVALSPANQADGVGIKMYKENHHGK